MSSRCRSFSVFASAAAIASANYVINEWLDARYDIFHPTKSQRPGGGQGALGRRSWFTPSMSSSPSLASALGAQVSKLFLLTSVLFLVSGIIYNVAPIRTKERVYLDVLSEALNNPIRLTLGWSMIDPTTLPPSSLLLGYWMGGAFLMTIKRFAEYRTVVATSGMENLGLYRRSFRAYTENTLLIAGFLYAQIGRVSSLRSS